MSIRALKYRNFEQEITFRTSRSGGKGGQHVNKTETKVELVFSVTGSRILTEAEKQMVHERCAGRINEGGELMITCATHRSQLMNKEEVLLRFYALLQKAFEKKKKRIATVIPNAVKRAAGEKKKRRSEVKQGRGMKTRDFL